MRVTTKREKSGDFPWRKIAAKRTPGGGDRRDEVGRGSYDFFSKGEDEVSRIFACAREVGVGGRSAFSHSALGGVRFIALSFQSDRPSKQKFTKGVREIQTPHA